MVAKAWVCRVCWLPTMDGPICKSCNGGRNATPTNPAYRTREYQRERKRLIAEHVLLHGQRCLRCGRRTHPGNPLTVDHPHPLSRGGAAVQPDMVVICRSCNSSLGNRTKPTQAQQDERRLRRRGAARRMVAL